MEELEKYCIFIRNGVNIKNNKEQLGIPITRIETISDGIIDKEKMGYANIFDNKYKDYYLKKNDILMSHINSMKHLGKVAFCDINMDIIHGMNLLNIRADSIKIYPKYLYYYFKSNDFKIKVNKISKQSVNQSSFAVSDLKKIKIKIVENKKQVEIVEKLDKIIDIINIRKNQIKLFENITKSQFVEMFGDPLTSNNFGRITLNKLTKVNQGLQIPISKRLNESGNNRYKYITIQYLNGGKETEYIENPNPRVICNKEDILMTRTGNTGQVITNVEGVFHNNFFKVDYDKSKLNKYFLIKYFEDEGIYRDMIRRATTSTIPDLSHGEFYKMSIDLPPLDLQNKFADFVKQVDKQKFEIENSLKEMQNLYESLMEKYFG